MSGIFEQLSGATAARAEGRSAQNIANYRAELQKQAAVAERQRAGFASKRQAKKAAAIKSTLEASLGQAGGLGSPVAADLAAEQAAELELENILIGFEGETKARRALDQAELDRLAGKQAKLKGKNLARARNIQFATQIATTPVGSKGGTLLTGF